MSSSVLPSPIDVDRESQVSGQALKLVSSGGTAPLGQATDDSAVWSEPTIHYLRELRVEERRFRLSKPLKVEVEATSDGSISAFATVLNIGGLGSSLDHATDDLADSLFRVWLELHDEPDETLHPSARDLRDRLRAIFGQ